MYNKNEVNDEKNNFFLLYDVVLLKVNAKNVALFTINNLGEIPTEHRAKTGMIYTEKLKP